MLFIYFSSTCVHIIASLCYNSSGASASPWTTLKMVLTSPEHHHHQQHSSRPPPTRGTTLPHTLMRQSHTDIPTLASNKVPRANTLPNSNRSLTLSTIDLNNAINNNQLSSRTRSPGGGHSVSIMSLPQSDDNDAFSFDNR